MSILACVTWYEAALPVFCHSYWRVKSYSNLYHLLTDIACYYWHQANRLGLTLVHAFIMSHVDYCSAVLAVSPRYITDKLQCVLNAAAHLVTSSTTACHTCYTRNCTGSTSQNVYTTNWESQCIAVCRTNSWVPGRLLYSSLRHSNPTSFTVSHSTSPDHTTFGRRAFSVTGPTVWNLLPDSLHDPALTSNSFRQSLKMNLFQCHYFNDTRCSGDASWLCTV